MPINTTHPASYRDPSGFIFTRDGIIYRQVNSIYAEDFDVLLSSGLYHQLTEKKWLIEHEEIPFPGPGPGVYKILKPRQVDFINYPLGFTAPPEGLLLGAPTA